MPRDSWVRFEGRTYPVPAARLVVSADEEGLWFDLYTGGEDDEVFQASGGLTINAAFVAGVASLGDLEGRELELGPDNAALSAEESFFWELGETLEIENMILRLGQRQGNLCTVQIDARLLRHESGSWRTLKCTGRVALVVEDA